MAILKKGALTLMFVSQYVCPRIRLTKTDNTHAIIPIDAITGIEEDKNGKCVKICTIDGFWYEVKNPILEIDKKIDDSITRVNGKVQIAYPGITDIPSLERIAEFPVPKPVPLDLIHENTKITKSKKKRMLSAGVEKPARHTQADSHFPQTSEQTPQTDARTNPTTKESISHDEESEESP